MILTNTLIRDYLLNDARPLIYTTSLSNTAIIAATCSFDLLEDGTTEKVLSPFHSLAIRKKARPLFTRATSPCCREARGPSSRTLYIFPGARLRPSLRCLSRPTYSVGSPSTTTLNDATSDADCTAFDAPGPRPVRLHPRTWTQRPSYQLAYGAKGGRSSTCIFTRRHHEARTRYASQRDCCVGCMNRSGG